MVKVYCLHKVANDGQKPQLFKLGSLYLPWHTYYIMLLLLPLTWNMDSKEQKQGKIACSDKLLIEIS